MKYLLSGGLAVVAIAMGIGLFFLPEKDNSKKESPAFLHLDLIDQSRLVSTDKLAELIISKDPTLLPIDMRSPEEYQNFTIPGAVNIPLAKILDEESAYYLELGEMQKVFFSNDDLTSNEAWMIAKRMGYENVYVMKGGLNEWVETILQPAEPPATASQEAFELYNLRKATSLYFIGGSDELQPEEFQEQAKQQPAAAPKKIAPTPKLKKAAGEEEGC